MRASVRGAAFIVATLLFAGSARAQQALPPLPTPTAEPPVPLPTAAPPASQPPPPPPAAAGAPPRNAYPYARPPRGPAAYAERKHAPEYALWLGGSGGLLAYSGGLYINDPLSTSGVETTGNFVRPGLALQADVGARLARRYIPYLTLEVGLVGAGRRFEGMPTNASTSFVGIGFRYLAGDVDSVSFASDISFGWRKFQVSNATGTWSASGFEIFRLGFGAEIRLSTRATVSPMITLSGGTLTDTSGNIQFAPNQPDLQTQPLFEGTAIPSAYQQTYFAIVVGCGVHVDLLGE
ncbi:MAG TPA: hypothetical protein VN894_21310 [Polyangiaceae bacterium]|nr:hypothetical protein [Polyangiaceae bacterium]